MGRIKLILAILLSLVFSNTHAQNLARFHTDERHKTTIVLNHAEFDRVAKTPEEIQRLIEQYEGYKRNIGTSSGGDALSQAVTSQANSWKERYYDTILEELYRRKKIMIQKEGQKTQGQVGQEVYEKPSQADVTNEMNKLELRTQALKEGAEFRCSDQGINVMHDMVNSAKSLYSDNTVNNTPIGKSNGVKSLKNRLNNNSNKSDEELWNMVLKGKGSTLTREEKGRVENYLSKSESYD